MKNSQMQSFVTAFFERLSQEQLQHAILRGETELEMAHPGSDIDLIVEPLELQRFERVLRSVAAQCGVQVWEEFRASALTQYYLHASSEAHTHEFFEIDVHTHETCYGVPFMSAAEFLSEDKEHAEVARLVANFLTPLLSGGEVQERYRAPLAECAAQNARTLFAVLTPIFGDKHAALFVQELDSPSPFQRASVFRGVLFRRCLFRSPIRSMAALARFFYSVRISPLFRPRGRFIALLGTDGSGKSTLAAEVAARLRPVFREGGVHQFHMRPGLMPQLSSLLTLKKTVYSEAEIGNPHRAKPSGVIGSVLRLLYYWSDYVLGSMTRILPLRRRNSLVLFDRYFDDYRVDSKRARIKSGLGLVQRLARYTPRPDVILVCTADLETVYSRKQEHDLEESARQLAAYETLARTDSRFQLINTSGELSDSVDQALEAIFAERAA